MNGKFLTTKELIECLQKYDPDSVPVVTRDGNGHSYALEKEGVFPMNNPYFSRQAPPEDCLFVNLGNV
jgi:hypothetical protein